MFNIKLVFIILATVLTGCSSSGHKNSLEIPLVIGRPTKSWCNENKNHALKIRKMVISNIKNQDAINSLIEKYETLFLHDGCTWLYETPDKFQVYYQIRQSETKNLLRQYLGVLSENSKKDSELSQLRQALHDINNAKMSIERQKYLLEQTGGGCYTQNGTKYCTQGGVDLY